MPLKLVYSVSEMTTSKKRMLRCALPSKPLPESSRKPPLDQLRTCRPDLAAVVDDIIAIYLEDTQ